MSYKKIIINSKADLSYCDGWLVINKDNNENREYLSDISAIVINSLEVNITTFLINELTKRDINLIFTDEKKNPASSLIPFYGSCMQVKKYNFQLSINEAEKDYVWMLIVKNKIMMQNSLVKVLTDTKLFEDEYLDSVLPNDPNNIEAFVARKYFYKLFGLGFNRREDNTINAALNYGYTILLSEINRMIVTNGYSTIFGIHHKNASNSFNLSCDIIESFRPFIDRIVYFNVDRELDKDYKKELVNCLDNKVLYKGKQYLLYNCIETYFIDIMNYFETGELNIGEIRFAN